MVQPAKCTYTTEVTRRGAVAARRAHNPKVSGSNPLAATNHRAPKKIASWGLVHAEMHAEHHFIAPRWSFMAPQTKHVARKGRRDEWWLCVRVSGRHCLARIVGMDARSLVGANNIRPGNVGKAIVMLRDFGVGIEISLLQIIA